eukprot:363303-Chlamydomonas_euryale.AAC.8
MQVVTNICKFDGVEERSKHTCHRVTTCPKREGGPSRKASGKEEPGATLALPRFGVLGTRAWEGEGLGPQGCSQDRMYRAQGMRCELRVHEHAATSLNHRLTQSTRAARSCIYS